MYSYKYGKHFSERRNVIYEEIIERANKYSKSDSLDSLFTLHSYRTPLTVNSWENNNVHIPHKTRCLQNYSLMKFKIQIKTWICKDVRTLRLFGNLSLISKTFSINKMPCSKRQESGTVFWTCLFRSHLVRNDFFAWH